MRSFPVSAPCATALLVYCTAATAGPDAGADPRLVDGIPLALLSSAYEHVGDTGTNASEHQHAKLLFHPSGAAFLIRDVEGKKLRAFQGSFSYRAGVVRLRFATDGFRRAASFPLDLAAAEVTLPFKVFSTGTGSSTWTRDGSADRLFDIVGDLCTGLVHSRGVGAPATVPFLERYVRLFIHPAGSPEIDLSPAPRILSMTAFRVSEGALGVDVEDPGWGGRVGGDYSSCFTDE